MRILSMFAVVLAIACPVEAGSVFYSSDADIYRADADGQNGTPIIADVSARHLAYNPTDNKLYWVSEANHRIQRSNLDGSDVETLLDSGVSQLAGLAVDGLNGHIYFTDLGSDKISRINLDGSGRVDLITAGLVLPRGIALDIANGHFYWIDEGTDKIVRADLDATNVTDIVTGLDAPRSVALDLANQQMYWTDAFAAKIQRSNLDGSSVVTLLTNSDVPGGLPSMDQITLDLVHGKLIVADGFNGEKLVRANLDGTDVETISTLNSVGVVYVDTTPVPEPSTISLLVVGVIGLVGVRRWSAK